MLFSTATNVIAFSGNTQKYEITRNCCFEDFSYMDLQNHTLYVLYI